MRSISYDENDKDTDITLDDEDIDIPFDEEDEDDLLLEDLEITAASLFSSLLSPSPC